MECFETRQQFNPLLEGELEGPPAREMEAHLASCPACRAEVEGLRRSLALLEGLPLLNPPPGFSARVMALVLQARASSQPDRGKGLAWALASLLGLVGSFLTFGYLSEQGLPWDAATLEAFLSQPLGLEDLPSLLVGVEVGVVVGVTLLFVALASLLVQLLGKEQQCQHGQA